MDGQFDIATRFSFLVDSHKTVNSHVVCYRFLDFQLVGRSAFIRCNGDAFARLDLDTFLEPFQFKVNTLYTTIQVD